MRSAAATRTATQTTSGCASRPRAPGGIQNTAPATLVVVVASPPAANVRTMGSNRDNLTKEYATDEIVVEWEPRLCYHSQNCVRSLPQVFDDSRRPWIRVDAATADEVEAAVARCPSGALRTRRIGVPPPRRQQPLEVRASANGPLLLS